MVRRKRAIERGIDVAAPPRKLWASVCFLLAVGASVAGQSALAASEETYPREQGQEHIGGKCTHDDAQVAGGTIVGAGGQVVAGGGGTGAGCDTFYAYEVRVGAPTVARPWTEPALYLNPGGTVRGLR